jgi:prevent-host-death family protein
MTRTFNTYDAKARFSEVLRYVRGGERVVVTWHGQPVAEIRPIETDDTFPARLETMVAERTLTYAAGDKEALQPVTHRSGALERFLEERE